MNSIVYQSTKSFFNFPCAHRQHLHHGHCKFVHGYSRSFHFLFESNRGELDACGFVMDFGECKEIKKWLDDNFDHTLLLNPNDPALPVFLALEMEGACKIRIIPTGVSMEGTARWVYDVWAPVIAACTNNHVRLVSVEVRENEKNSGIFKVERV
jgi:6-pyruvoyltetrahydropterin/6-carboxytetrahydropterin synthase